MNGTHEDRFIGALRKEAAQELPPPEEEDAQSPVSVETTEPEEPKPAAGKGGSAPLTPRNVFEHHDSHPLLLDMLLIRKFGPLWLDWEPETIWTEIKDDFKQATISVHNRNKIQAVKLCHLLDTPWTAWEQFVVVCQSLNNNVPNFRTLQKPTIAQVMSAVDIMDRIREAKFSEEVLKFISACFLDEGVVYLPPPVDEAQQWASEPRYRCKRCGKIDRDDDNDICDSCGASSKHLVKALERDYRPVKARYDECVRLGDDRPELQETPEDVQTARLLVARDYVLSRREQLRQQVRVMRDVSLYV